MIAGFDYPTEGDVFLDGRNISFEHPSRRNIGMVFQKYALFPHMTVLDNIAYPLKVRGLAKGPRRQEARRALEVVQLAEHMQKLPSQLSGGQQQRVALARAFVFNPRLLLMDEPLSALDKSLRESLQFELKRLQRVIGATVVFVTHDQNEALTMSDRIAVINEGRLEQVGSPEELYSRPVSPFVASFLGETNKIPARVESGGVVHSGSNLPCSAVSGFPENKEVTLFVRPDRVRLTPATGPVAAGSLRGEVSEIVFSGSQYLCVLRVAGGLTLHARIDAKSMPPIAPDTEAFATWESSDAFIFSNA